MWLLDFCNCVWNHKTVPEDWHLQQVTLIFKKGDPGDCNNYRPICLLAAAYKIFAMVLLQRLLAAGADARVWPTQFGIRAKCGTEDALHCARRAVELAWSRKEGKLHMLAATVGSGLAQSVRFNKPESFVASPAPLWTARPFHRIGRFNLRWSPVPGV